MWFDPAKDIPNLAGKVCLVTGANSGLGEAAVRALAQHAPGKIYLACRSQEKGEAALARIRASSTAAKTANLVLLRLDLADFASVRAAAARVLSETDRLDVLQLNGGVGSVPQALTKDGYEIHFGTNYLGNVLLTQLLMPLLLATASLSGADVRVVWLTSATHRLYAPPEGILFEGLKTDMAPRSPETFMNFSAATPKDSPSRGMSLYAQANLAKVVVASELARRFPAFTTVSVHPGIVRTPIWGGDKDMPWLVSLFGIPALLAWKGVGIDEGAKGQLWCSFADELVNGAYYEPYGKLGEPNPLVRDEALARRLWEWTERELAERCGTAWPLS